MLGNGRNRVMTTSASILPQQLPRVSRPTNRFKRFFRKLRNHPKKLDLAETTFLVQSRASNSLRASRYSPSKFGRRGQGLFDLFGKVVLPEMATSYLKRYTAVSSREHADQTAEGVRRKSEYNHISLTYI